MAEVDDKPAEAVAGGAPEDEVIGVDDLPGGGSEGPEHMSPTNNDDGKSPFDFSQFDHRPAMSPIVGSGAPPTPKRGSAKGGFVDGGGKESKKKSLKTSASAPAVRSKTPGARRPPGGGAKDPPRLSTPDGRKRDKGHGSDRATRVKPTARTAKPGPKPGSPLKRGSRAKGRSGSSDSQPAVAIAGYRSPTDLSCLDESVIEEARTILSDDAGLRKMLRDRVFKHAAERVGVDLNNLLPRKAAQFSTGPDTTLSQLKMRKEHYDRRRIENLALVLAERPAASKKVDAREQRATRAQTEMAESLERAILQERTRVQKALSARRKVESVVIAENELLVEQRKSFEDRMDTFAAKQQRIQEAKQRRREEVARASTERAAKIALVQKQKEEREAARIDEIRHAREERSRKLEEHKARMDEEQARHRAMIEKREAEREFKRENAQDSVLERRETMMASIREREETLAALRRKKIEEMEARKEERFLLAQTRAMNAERVRREKHFRQQAVVEALDAMELKMKYRQELDKAIMHERIAQHHKELIRRHKWEADHKLERHVTPGPGEYGHRSLPGPAGGSWSKFRPKSDLEWAILRAKKLPGPGQYKSDSALFATPGGTWGKYNSKSDVEWTIYRAKQLPAVGDYEPAELKDGFHVRFSKFTPKSDIEILEDRSRALPGPGQYAPPMPDVQRPSIKRIKAKLDRAVKKANVAAKFITRTSSAARARRASVDAGTIEPPREVTPRGVEAARKAAAKLAVAPPPDTED